MLTVAEEECSALDVGSEVVVQLARSCCSLCSAGKP